MKFKPFDTRDDRGRLVPLTWGILLILQIPPAGFAADSWMRDIEAQRPNRSPQLEARYTSAERDGFMIDAERYSIELNLSDARHHTMSAISAYGETLFQQGSVEIVDATGTVWNSLDVETPSRVNLYRRGPYYDEVHWLDMAFTNGDGQVAPIRGEVVFYAYAESCRIGVVLHATADIRVQRIALVMRGADDGKRVRVPFPLEKNECIAYEGRNRARLAWFSTTAPRAQLSLAQDRRLTALWLGSDDEMSLRVGQPQQFDVGLVVLKGRDAWRDLRAELEPLPPERLECQQGLRFEHDARRGCYVVSTHNPGSFSYHYYESPNDYPTARVRLGNGDYPRKVYLCHETGSGSKGQVECGVILDNRGEALPILVQISKNFAGEKEEKFYNPQDTAFSEIWNPLYLDANETCELTSLQLYQNWGNHPLKQFSSLGAWMDYFHMSTGVTETTCYVPFKYSTGISIADLRGMSGTMWKSQPQHDNVGGHIFMEYLASDRPGPRKGRQVMEYLGTSYHSTGPNWAHVTFEFLSSDERLHTTLETFEFPQLDELRNFIRLKIRALEDVPIEEWAKDFRILQIDTRTQSLRYENVTYTDAAGALVTKPIAFDNSWSLCGEAMSGKAPTAAIWNSPKGNNAFIVEDYRGTIGGEPLQGLALSCEGRENGDSNLILVPQSEASGLSKGDEFEIDLFIMPFGKESEDYSAAFRERERYGLRPVGITDVRSGEVLSHFPPRLRATGPDLRFGLTGGFATVCVLIEGLDDYRGWKLQQLQGDNWKTLVHRNEGGEAGIRGEGQQRYVCDDGTFGVGFRVRLDGEATECRLVRD